MNISMKSGNMTINGKTYSGNNIIISNGKVIVDGAEQSEVLEHNIVVNVTGDVQSLETTSGDVQCESVSGDVKTVSGDVNVRGNVAGNVKTVSGDISYKK